MNGRFYFLSICCLLTTIWQAGTASEGSAHRGRYLGHHLPGYKPEPFAPEIFSAWNDYGLHPQSSVIFSPGGDGLFFVDQSYPLVKGSSRSIWYMHQVGNVWYEPEVADFSSNYDDYGVFLSKDGNTIYFSSTRPPHSKGSPRDTDIWYVRSDENGFSEPALIGGSINTAYDEVSGAAMEGGLFLISSNRPGGRGGFDVYISSDADGNYTGPENLCGGINTEADERVLCASSDLGLLIFHRHDRKREADAGLYISYRNADNSWTEPKSLGDHINMLNAKWASLSPDGEFFFFLGEGHGIYWLRAELLDYLRIADLNISEALLQTFFDRGIESACAAYFAMKKEHERFVDLDEFFLNQKGFQLLQAGDIARAVGIFKICVGLFPASWNAHDSLAEAYLVAGETELAKTHYRKSLELNPQNGNAKQRIEELEIK